MKLKELSYGEKFKTINNNTLTFTKGLWVIKGRRHLFRCKVDNGQSMDLPEELEVIKTEENEQDRRNGKEL